MILPVATQCAGPAAGSGATVLQGSQGWRIADVKGIEVDQMRFIDNAMRIMAGRAGGRLVHDMEAVPAGLAEGVNAPEALVTEDAGLGMALVAEREIAGVIDGGIGIAIGHHQLPLEDRTVSGPVRPVRAGAARGRSLVVVVAIGAFHETDRGPGSDQAGDISVLAQRRNRVKRSVGLIKLQAHIGLRWLVGDIDILVRIAKIGMAPVTELVFAKDWIGDGASGVHSDGAGDWSGSVGGQRGGRRRRVGIVTIDAAHVGLEIQRVFRGPDGNGLSGLLPKLGLE